jgi:hypothetical protein
MPERYRAQSYSVLPFAATAALAYLGDRIQPRLLRVEVAAALETLRSFATIEEHGERIAARLRDPRFVEKAKAVLAELVAYGVLVRESDVVASLTATGEAPIEVAPIHTLAVPTCNRVESLARSLDQFAAHAERSGRRLRIVVGDDSTEPVARAATREAVRRVAAARGVEASYLGPEHRERHTERLAAESGVPVEVVRFGLLGDAACGPPIGANRNALLLACMDEPTLWADDDVEPRAAAPVQREPGVALGFDGDPYVIAFFPDRESVLGGVVPEEHDPFALHERWLGSSLPGLTSRGGRPVDVTDATTEMLRDIRDQRGRVVVSFTGIYGDAAMTLNTAFLFWSGRQARAGALSDDSFYRRAMTSREMLRSAPRPTLVPLFPFMATSFGFDPRGGFPPAFPVLRNEDAMFGTLLARCFEGSYGVHLPVAYLHAPSGKRVYVERDAAAVGVGFVELLIAFMNLHPFDVRAGDWRDRLRLSGEHMRLWAESPAREFFSVAHQALMRAATGTAMRAQLLLNGLARDAPHWARDLVSFLEKLGGALPGERYPLPLDLPGRDGPGGPDAVVRLMQRLARDFGRLLEAWPALIEAERRLRAAGEGIGEPA